MTDSEFHSQLRALCLSIVYMFGTIAFLLFAMFSDEYRTSSIWGIDFLFFVALTKITIDRFAPEEDWDFPKYESQSSNR